MTKYDLFFHASNEAFQTNPGRLMPQSVENRFWQAITISILVYYLNHLNIRFFIIVHHLHNPDLPVVWSNHSLVEAWPVFALGRLDNIPPPPSQTQSVKTWSSVCKKSDKPISPLFSNSVCQNLMCKKSDKPFSSTENVNRRSVRC